MTTEAPSASAGKVFQILRGEDAVGGVGTIEVIGLPQVLHTRTFGSLEMLFLALLDTCRSMMSFIEKMTGAGESKVQAVSMARIRFASELLQDSSFTLATHGLEEDNTYIVDFDKGTLVAGARLYAVVRQRTSLFKITIEGNIKQGPYVVQNTTTGVTMLKIEEDEMRKPGYFATFLPEECLRAHIEGENSNPLGKTVATQGEVRLVVPVPGGDVQFLLRQKDNAHDWDILDGRTNHWLGALPDSAEAHLRQLMEGLALIAMKD